MDNKQKKQILSAVYKALTLFILAAIAWVCYYSINNLIQQTGILWLNIALLTEELLLLSYLFTILSKTKKIKNLFGLAKYLFLLLFITFSAIIAGIFVVYYTKFILDIGYYLTIGILLVSHVLSLIMFVVSFKLTKLYKSTTITIDPIAEVPNYDDELMLKKQLDELNRKLEMKKVVERIESIKNELGEN
ncbi:MAG: hypothetical protein E7376_00290 [Clostridiales bacterium]|nr:hypothetical protein [Clostridiales bacterium]